MSRKKRRQDPADPFPLISWEGVPDEEPVGTAVVDAPPPVETPAAKAAAPSRKERKEKRKKERAAASAPATTPLPKLRTGFDSRFFFRDSRLGGVAPEPPRTSRAAGRDFFRRAGDRKFD
jgi:hypothetical protein